MSSLLIPVLAIAPGIVLLNCYRRNRRANEAKGEWRFFATSLIASFFPHVMMSPWTLLIAQLIKQDGFSSTASQWETRIWIIYLLFLVPIVLGILASDLVDSQWLNNLVLGRIGFSRAARTRTAWEWLFGPEPRGWVIVRLRDGRLLGGKFGRESFASLEPGIEQDLYLKEPNIVWPNGKWIPIPKAVGIWINATDIVNLEFYD